MPFRTAARTATVLVAACLIALHSSATPASAHSGGRPSWRSAGGGSERDASRTQGPPSSAGRTPKAEPPLDGSCEKLAARQSPAYMARLKAKEYAAARDIARKTADLCLEAGDFKRAASWFQAARAVGSGPSSSAAKQQDEQFRQRYQQGLARLKARQNDVAAAEERIAAKRKLAGGAPPAEGAPSTASKTPSAAPAVPPSSGYRQRESSRLSWIAVAGGFGLLVLAAVVLVRRNAARRRDGPTTKGRK